jgi:hypothetical protein
MTPPVQVDKGFLARSLAVVALSAAAAGGLVVWALQDGQPSPAWGLALAGSVVAVWVGVFWVIVRPFYFAYRCPSCNERLPRMVPGRPGRYHCRRCEVVWDLVIRPGDSM